MNLKNSLIYGQELFNDSQIIIKLVNSNNLIKLYKNNILIIPPSIKPIDNLKINEIKNKIIYNGKYNWLLSQGRITIGLIDSINDNYLYILDGKYRFNALIDLNNYNCLIEIILIKFDNIKSLKEYHNDINKNSELSLDYNFFDDKILMSTIERFKEWLKSNYDFAFRKSIMKSDNNHNYSIDEFVNLFKIDSLKQFFKFNNDEYDNIDKLIDRLNTANLIVRNKLIDLQMINKRQNYISDKDYDKCTYNNFYLAYNQIDSVSWILNLKKDIEILYVYKPKMKISITMKKYVWKKRNGSSMDGKCFCCDEFLEYNNLHCGHIVSELNGGLTNLDNLEPICMICNLSMGTKNMNVYKEELLKFKNDLNYINDLEKKIN